MSELVRQARRRLLYNELLAQGANAFSAAFFAVILLLLLGTQILNWYWLVLIPVGAAAFGINRTLRRLPSSYQTAQIVDRRMELADTVSTALFFSDGDASARVDPGVLKWQFESAEKVARTVDVRRAVPFTAPRTLYLMGALILVASSLFALRFGLNKRLDLRPPLARIFQQTFGGEDRKELAENIRRRNPQATPDPDEDSGASVADPEKKGQDQQDSPSENSAEQNGEQSSDKAGSKEDGKKQDGQNKDGEAQDSQADGKQDQQDQQDGNQSGPGKIGDSKSESKQQEGKEGSKNSSEGSSLMSKFKDAVQNLISSMKPPQNNQNQQSQQDQKSQQGKGQQSSGKQQQSAKDGQPQNGSQQADAQEGQQGGDQKDSQESPGKGSGKSDSQQANKQPGSGIGSEDGNKQIRDAQQLAAMGKLTELFGKRSATITGEATVEVQSTSQQLHTAYAQRSAEHAQGGAEITRDEIPVALQGYVEQYFEQVRKLAAAPAAGQPAVKK